MPSESQMVLINMGLLALGSLSAFVAIRGNTWRSNARRLRKLTATGWLAMLFVVSTFGLGWWKERLHATARCQHEWRAQAAAIVSEGRAHLGNVDMLLSIQLKNASEAISAGHLNPEGHSLADVAQQMSFLPPYHLFRMANRLLQHGVSMNKSEIRSIGARMATLTLTAFQSPRVAAVMPSLIGAYSSESDVRFSQAIEQTSKQVTCGAQHSHMAELMCEACGLPATQVLVTWEDSQLDVWARYLSSGQDGSNSGYYCKEHEKLASTGFHDLIQVDWSTGE